MNLKDRKVPVARIALILLGCMMVASAAFAAQYTSERLGLQFEMPAEWSTDGELGGRMFDDPTLILLPASKEESSANAVGITVSSKSLERADTPKDMSQVENYHRDFLAAVNFSHVSGEDVTIGGLPAKQNVYVGSLKGIEEKIRHKKIYLFHKNRFLMISFSSTESHFDAQWQTAKTFFETLKFIS